MWSIRCHVCLSGFSIMVSFWWYDWSCWNGSCIWVFKIVVEWDPKDIEIDVLFRVRELKVKILKELIHMSLIVDCVRVIE